MVNNQIRFPLRNENPILHRALDAKDFDSGNYISRSGNTTSEIVKLLKSEGGCLLFCGHMGVGKTSVVHHALSSWNQESADKVIEVWINVSQPLSPKELNLKIIKKLAQKMLASEKDPMQLAEYAMLRVLASEIKTSKSETSTQEQSGELSADSGLFRINFGSKQGNEAINSMEWARGSIDEIESQELIASLIQVSEQKNIVLPLHRRIIESWKHFLEDFSNRVKVFFRGNAENISYLLILDELDKLENDETNIIKLINGLKFIFSDTPVRIILISGKDTYYKIKQPDESIYKNLITKDAYLPCTWDDTKSVLHWYIDMEKIDDKNNIIWLNTDFTDYLKFSSNGNLRTLFSEIAQWTTGTFLEFSIEDIRLINRMAAIERILDQKVFSRLPKDPLHIYDNKRLEIYRIVKMLLFIGQRYPGSEIKIADNKILTTAEEYPTITYKYNIDVDGIFDSLRKCKYVKKIIDDSVRLKGEKPTVKYIMQKKCLEILSSNNLIEPDPAFIEDDRYTLISFEELVNFHQDKCPCNVKFFKNDAIVLCNNCKNPQHQSCWSKRNGCSVHDCAYYVSMDAF